MNTFLNIVAKDLYRRFGNDMSRVAVVFPNRRAGLFFNECLTRQSDAPLWAPAYLSVKDLFQDLSSLRLGDPIELVCRLYTIFKEASGSKEQLEDFYFWGELLIGDFDDVDKNLVDADKLFGNLAELQEMADDFSFLSEEQEEAIQQFFKNFTLDKKTEMKEKFVALWNVLQPVYHRYREELSGSGIAYEGMMYRDVIENLNVADLKYDHYVLVGFNVLNKVEHRFFEILRDAEKAIFYWDYDEYYTDKMSNEAGVFIKKNLVDFPQSLPVELFDELSKPKKITYISATTENAQARYLPQWIHEYVTADKSQKASECSVVLCNEALLLPVLHSLPDDTGDVNVTMGFPLQHTPVYGFVTALLDLQTDYDRDKGRYAYKTVQSALHHPYTYLLCKDESRMLSASLTKSNKFYPLPMELYKTPDLEMIFTPTDGTNKGICKYLLSVLQKVALIYRNDKKGDHDMYNQLYRESLFQAYTIVNRLNNLITSDLLQVNFSTFKRLLNRLLAAASIPFHGEPVIGMQVMGVLETRNLDFKHLIMLSLNEGQLPKVGADASFVPYNLRKAFGMTTIEHANSVYAYYFYRLIQRAETITLVYNNSTDGTNSREMSRFMLQMLVEWPHVIEKKYLEAPQQPTLTGKIVIDKSPEVMDRLIKRFTGVNPKNKKVNMLSPSALNKYLSCPLKFYFMYVARLRPEDDVTTDIDSAMFGTIFHKTAENLYKSFGKQMIMPEMVDSLLNNPQRIQDEVDRSFKTEFFGLHDDSKPEYDGLQLINSRVICSYVKQLLRNDRKYAPFSIFGTEKEVKGAFRVPLTGGESVDITMGGEIDRIDTKEGVMRIVDYKTGGQPATTKSVESLFIPDEKRPGYILQTFIYAYLLGLKQPNWKIAPSLMYIHKAAKDDYSPVIEINKQPVTDFEEYREEFVERLRTLLQEIFDESKPFEQTKLSNSCAYCDFKAICGK